MSILAYELVEYRIFYSLNRCFTRFFSEEAIKEYNILSKEHHAKLFCS